MAAQLRNAATLTVGARAIPKFVETASRSERRRRDARRRHVGELIGWGITSVSANIDALSRVRETIARTEQKMLLEKARAER